MNKIKALKALLKDKAKYIKNQRNEARKIGGWEAHKIHTRLYPFSYEYRIHHIAYCELRGRTREQIEIPRDTNLPNEKWIRDIKKEYGEQDEIICIGS